MPIGEIETHPYLHQGEISGASKLILGSFPVYECTDQDGESKQKTRQKEGTIRFFYGSSRSKLWELYGKTIDSDIPSDPNPNQILQSLAKSRIAVSDTIYSCERHLVSSEDSKLIRRIYNRDGVQKLIQDGVRRIVCTSKGVLNDLEKQIVLFGANPFGQVNVWAGDAFQSVFLANIGGKIDPQKDNPICKVFLIDNFWVTALAIPSPGSPQRQLAKFGFDGKDWRLYADNYFMNAFNWLNE